MPVVEEISPPPTVTDALTAFAGEPWVLLLDSGAQGERGRYSFLSADPIQTHLVERVAFGSDPLQAIRESLSQVEADPIPELPPFQGGAAGVLSYELGTAWERFPRAKHDEFQLPDLAIGIYDWVLAWDHAADRAWIISQGHPAPSLAARTDRAARRAAWVKRTLAEPPQTSWQPQPSRISPANQTVIDETAGLSSDFSKDEYLRTVQRAIEYIHAGDVFQVNLSQRLLAPQRHAPWELYARLRACNPAPFAGYLAVDDWAIISASPERFLQVRGGEVETRPIKGTRSRQPRPEADLFTRDELRESEKDVAENVMIVDLLRNDLSRVCEPGSVRVPHLCEVETYETVQHLVSEIRGRLQPDKDVWDLLAAAFPGGSITGAPKVRAMEIIAELEPTVRGPYCGNLFYCGFDGTFDSNILIRTFLCRHGWVQCPVGGGIVAQSDPHGEYEETWTKAAGMLRALKHIV